MLKRSVLLLNIIETMHKQKGKGERVFHPSPDQEVFYQLVQEGIGCGSCQPQGGSPPPRQGMRDKPSVAGEDPDEDSLM